MQTGNRGRQLVNEINITPLTDVFLVLLIIMMILQTSANLLFAGQIRPPEVTGAETAQATNEACIIEITSKSDATARERISIDSVEVDDVAGLVQPLRSAANNGNKKRMMLRADRDASSDIVLQVIDTIQTVAGEFTPGDPRFALLSELTISVDPVRAPAAGTAPSPPLPAAPTAPPVGVGTP